MSIYQLSKQWRFNMRIKEKITYITGTLMIVVGTCVILFFGLVIGLFMGQNMCEVGRLVQTDSYFTEMTDVAESKLPVETELTEEIDLEPVEGTIIKATWYSREGCINCHPQLIMANGKPLDDNAYALAYDAVPLGTIVTLCNMAETNCVDAEVTDRIGDPLHADLTPILFQEFAPLGLGVIDRMILYPQHYE